MRIYKVILLLVFISCKNETFELKDASIGISFTNKLTFTNEFNVYKYRNFYNGGGVAIGDINNDGLQDVYLTSNQEKNKLFLNLGNFKFKDITDSAGVSGAKAWSTGVTMVDVNADGLLDIYVCNSGDIKGDNKENELFINQGNLRFKEEAEIFNLNDGGYSTHASFFDYDKDGDLDVYLLNNSYQAIGSFDLRRNERPKRDYLGGDKLLKNENGVYIDVSESAGIFGSVIGFGLGVTVGDINGDNWDDIFVSNDFFERDYLYINQKNGTFKENLTNQMMSISGASMGADLADINNDGQNDIFVTEMLPSDYERLKSVTTFEGWDKYQYNVKNGYHHQFTRNVLHLNGSNNKFSEIGRFAGVESTDWSWGALLFDFDNDGLKDLFVANGIYRDLTNQDYLQYISNSEVVKSIVKDNQVNYQKLVEIIPSNPVSNHAFKNLNGIEFEELKSSGLQIPSFSNGAAYGDLDNDGDLDLIVNNVNMPAFVFENKTNEKANYIKLELIGEGKNSFSIGAKVYITANGQTQMQQIQTARGFQSSADLRPNFGLANSTSIKIKVIWPSGKETRLEGVQPNQVIRLKEKDAELPIVRSKKVKNLLFKKTTLKGSIKHIENKFVDFNRDRLLFHMCSTEGPKIDIADIDKNGIPDFFLTGSLNKQITSFNVIENQFIKNTSNELFNNKLNFENSRNLFFDVDNDDDLDLYIASGSVELSLYSEMLFDRILLNDGKGNFIKTTQKLPDEKNKISTGSVSYSDIDGDGDYDLFVGERLKINNYGLPASGYILINDGKGKFHNMTSDIAPELENIGMITDSAFSDIDNDGDFDLIIVGEYMGIELFINNEGKLKRANNKLNSLKGWWNKIKLDDLNNDGLVDLIVGNHGLNSRFKASKKNPIKLYFNDFDNNGFTESIICFTSSEGKEYPYSLRHDLIDQIKSLKKIFPNYDKFKSMDMTKIFGREKLVNSSISEVNFLETAVFINQGNYNFSPIALPKPVQFSPIYGIETGDFDQDGDQDILMGGNLYGVKPEFGIYDAGRGIYLENINGQTFKYHKDGKGFSVEGQIRDIKVLNDKIFVAKNNDAIEVFKILKNNE